VSRRNVLLERLETLVAEEHARKRQRVTVRQAELEHAVASYLSTHPDANAAQVCSAVQRRRSDVIAAMHRFRRLQAFPQSGNGIR
jgi:hypothetical protein